MDLLTASSHAQWLEVPGPSGARVNCFGVRGDTVIGGFSYGIIRSSDRGYTWAWSTGALRGQEIHDIDDDPPFWFAAGNSAVFVSSDCGRSWYPCADFPVPVRIFNMTVNPRGLFVASDSGLMYSTDHGGTWRGPLEQPFYRDGTSTPWIINSLDSSLIAGVISGSGGNLLGRSRDGGVTWEYNAGVPGWGIVSLYAGEGMVLAGVKPYGVLRSSDNGTSWKLSTAIPSTFTSFSRAGGILYAGVQYVDFWSRNEPAELFSSVVA